MFFPRSYVYLPPFPPTGANKVKFDNTSANSEVRCLVQAAFATCVKLKTPAERRKGAGGKECRLE